MTQKQAETFEIGDRVRYNSDVGNRLNGHLVAGEIVDIIHHMALIRPDDYATSRVMITTRYLRDIGKEIADE